MDRYGFQDKRVRPDALIALVLGIGAAWLVGRFIGILVDRRFLLLTIVAVAVGGAWYSYRKVL